MTYRKKMKPWQKEKRKKDYEVCICGAVLKHCTCGVKKGKKND